MALLKMLSACLFLFAAASALVYQPEEGLRPPKRPVPPAPPTLAPNPYASAFRSPPSPTGSLLLSQPQQPLGLGGVSPIVPGPHQPLGLGGVSPLVPGPQQPLGLGGVSPILPGPQLPERGFQVPLTQGVPPEFREEVRDKQGQFAIRFSNGKDTIVSETGELSSTDEGWEYVILKKGSYSYISPEGTPITVNYVADENGFHPKVSFN